MILSSHCRARFTPKLHHSPSQRKMVHAVKKSRLKNDCFISRKLLMWAFLCTQVRERQLSQAWPKLLGCHKFETKSTLWEHIIIELSPGHYQCMWEQDPQALGAISGNKSTPGTTIPALLFSPALHTKVMVLRLRLETDSGPSFVQVSPQQASLCLSRASLSHLSKSGWP